MALKRKIHNPQGYIAAGMVFFLIAMFVNMIGDVRLIGEFLSGLVSDETIWDHIRGFATGLSIPLCGASIYFNIRGLVLLRLCKTTP